MKVKELKKKVQYTCKRYIYKLLTVTAGKKRRKEKKARSLVLKGISMI